jgi:hypothetical protein
LIWGFLDDIVAVILLSDYAIWALKRESQFAELAGHVEAEYKVTTLEPKLTGS